MRIVTPTIIIEEGESFKQDILERSSFGKSLLNLVTQSNDELVISLDGEWGEGKTTFVKMWKGMLSEQGIPNVYIDAFANDYVDDAFISVASAITSYIDNNTVNPDKKKSKEFKENIKSVGIQLLSWTAKVGIKAATLGAIKESDLKDLKDIKADLAKGVSNIVGEFIEERLATHAKDVEILESFKVLLSEIPTLLSEDGDKPLVIIVDELDRCKPSYAVELIEKIKHLFSVKNVVFVLVMHRKQLEEAVKCIYGENIDAQTYLQKFINIETKLPKQSGDLHVNDISKYNRQLFSLYEIETWGDKDNLINSLEALAIHFNLSLRQLERVYTNIAIFYASSAQNQLRLVPIVSFLAVIKVVNSILYNELLQEKVTYQELSKRVNISDKEEDTKKRTLKFIAAWLKFALISGDEFHALAPDDRVRDFGQAIFSYNLDRKDLIPVFIKKLNLFSVA